MPVFKGKMPAPKYNIGDIVATRTSANSSYDYWEIAYIHCSWTGVEPEIKYGFKGRGDLRDEQDLQFKLEQKV